MYNGNIIQTTMINVVLTIFIETILSDIGLTAYDFKNPSKKKTL